MRVTWVGDDEFPANETSIISCCLRCSAELAQVGEKLDKIKRWTVEKFKNTKQQVFEHLGKVRVTVG